MTRRELRENVFQLLFMCGFHDPGQQEVQLALCLEGDLLSDHAAENRNLILEKLSHVLSHVEEEDSIIGECTEGWRVDRLSRVDLSILRLAVDEMLFDEEVPYRVAINEAVELAKKFGGDDSPSFINGILGKVSKLKGLEV